MEKKYQNIKDYVNAASELKVQKLILISLTLSGPKLRIISFPHGPSYTFLMSEYSNSSDICKNEKYSRQLSKLFDNNPLVVFHYQSKSEEENSILAKNVTPALREMFAPLKLTNFNPDTSKRVVLFSYEKEKNEEFIYFRHYEISSRQRNENKSIRKLVNRSKINLSNYLDISDFILNSKGGMSDSEAEDLPNSKINLPIDVKNRPANSKIALRLFEIGPRIKLKLLKIEEGLMNGNILYIDKKLQNSSKISNPTFNANKRISKLKRKNQKNFSKINKGKDQF